MYGMTNHINQFFDENTNCIINEAFLKYSQCQMYIYQKYSPDGSKLVVLSYVGECVYWYTYEELGKWFVDKLVKIFHVIFLGCAHWFMSIRISKLQHYFISVDQARYATSDVAKYLENATIKIKV